MLYQKLNVTDAYFIRILLNTVIAGYLELKDNYLNKSIILYQKLNVTNAYFIRIFFNMNIVSVKSVLATLTNQHAQ